MQHRNLTRMRATNIHSHLPMVCNGEHIIEILASGDDDWLRGVQFITNKGRCSAIYGTLEGVPTIARSKGGILAGLSVTSKVHPTRGYLATSVRGIWRHDLIPHAPKENDVFSEYFGARTHHGSGFNDRALVGNSSTMYISRVEFWAGVEIDSIQDGFKFLKAHVYRYSWRAE
ncbi:Jacalin domain-containing protein [Rhizoctonia solani AG-1 IA]|uniref:Jacalin domain-containing protein n=1 Tax=Thanatephorus cucumeris (strain AG1-IA) TaxID=983506 RepID=L8WGT5_THACA|nr:Jacalin domain-containing protein [Rhizoctonia solani AG-1 IA]